MGHASPLTTPPTTPLSIKQCLAWSKDNGNPRVDRGICHPNNAARVSAFFDPHVKHHHPNPVVELASLLRGRRLLLLGDSITRQFAQALWCEANRTLDGGLQRVTIEVPIPRLLKECRRIERHHRNLSKAFNSLSPDGRAELRRVNFAMEHVAWPCHRFGAHYIFDDGTVKIGGWRAVATNFTWFPGIGPQANLFTTPDVEQIAKEPLSVWPTRLQLAVQNDLADVIVLGFGLHYAFEGTFRGALKEAFQQLHTFTHGRRSQRLGVFREISAQHFTSVDGTYEAAKATDLSLVLATNASRALAQPCSQQLEAKSTWRNRVLKAAYEAARRRHGWQAEAIQLQPFERITRARWDYHLSRAKIMGGINRRGTGRAWKYDCTHFCYSPPFWQAALHGLSTTLRAGFRVR